MVKKAVLRELSVLGPADVKDRGLPLELKARLTGIILKWLPPPDLLRAQEAPPVEDTTSLPPASSVGPDSPPRQTPPRPSLPNISPSPHSSSSDVLTKTIRVDTVVSSAPIESGLRPGMVLDTAAIENGDEARKKTGDKQPGLALARFGPNC